MRSLEPQPDEPFCRDPTHDEHCDCGARPDWEYQKRVEERGPR